MAHSMSINRADNGFTITTYTPSKGDIYTDPKELVATDKEQALKIVTDWLSEADKE